MPKRPAAHRTDEKAAYEVLARLIQSPAALRAIGRLVAQVVDVAESVAPNSWELTLRRSDFFLNVGQVAVLTVNRDVISLYTSPLRRRPRGLEEYVDGRRYETYRAVDVPVSILGMTHDRVTSIEPEIVRALRAFVKQAANAKSSSPWKTAHSPAAIDVLGRACNREIPQPGYYHVEDVDDDDTKSVYTRDLERELAASRDVEEAAVRVVSERYRTGGWSVTSKEAANIGYDLFCKRGREVVHVEVKGRARDGDVVILTSGEWDRARTDKHWLLAIVANAASKSPAMTEYPGTALQRTFSVAPVAFRLRRTR